MIKAIILAAGAGKRMKFDKLFAQVCEKPVIYYSLMAFNDHPLIDEVIIAGRKGNIETISKLVRKYRFRKVKKVIEGGESRQKSLEKSLMATDFSKNDLVLVHNGANPLPSAKEITSVIKLAGKTGAAIVGHPMTSTIKELNGKHILRTHDRSRLFAAETPQAAKFGILRKAMDFAKERNLSATDEAMLLEAIGQKVAIVEADPNNFKITFPSDLDRLRTILGETPKDFAVGIGQDSHVFEDKIKGLTLGGIFLPNEAKLKANSDGDVILHAIFNAISQAIGEKSLGFYADPMCEAGIIDSKKYLEPLLNKVKKKKMRILSVGIMIECAKPKIDPLNAELKRSLSEILQIPENIIGITATTGENITAFGKGLGIQCFAIVSLRSAS